MDLEGRSSNRVCVCVCAAAACVHWNVEPLIARCLRKIATFEMTRVWQPLRLSAMHAFGKPKPESETWKVPYCAPTAGFQLDSKVLGSRRTLHRAALRIFTQCAPTYRGGRTVCRLEFTAHVVQDAFDMLDDAVWNNRTVRVERRSWFNQPTAKISSQKSHWLRFSLAVARDRKMRRKARIVADGCGLWRCEEGESMHLEVEREEAIERISQGKSVTKTHTHT